MRQLLLLRHARAVPAVPPQDDRDRPLNEAGRRAITAMRAAMLDLGLAPDLVLVSPARRTLDTLDALEPWDETPLVEVLDELYLASPAAIRSALNGVAETVRSVLLIGHNPGLHEFATGLLDGSAAPARARQDLAEGFPTAALAEFSVPGPWWQLESGRARLVRFISPKSLGREQD